MRPAPLFLVSALTVGIAAAPALAQPGPWGPGMMPAPPPSARTRHASDSREGQVTSATFAANGAENILGRGAIAVSSLPDSTPEARDRLDYEAAMIDRLVLAGYETGAPDADCTQLAEIRVSRHVAEPAEQKRSPVSGSTAVSVSNRGTAYGMALNVDLTEPRTALIATHMDLRIRDRASGEVLWEGRADILTRDGDEKWDEPAIATRLTAALMEGFPAPRG